MRPCRVDPRIPSCIRFTERPNEGRCEVPAIRSIDTDDAHFSVLPGLLKTLELAGREGGRERARERGER